MNSESPTRRDTDSSMAQQQQELEEVELGEGDGSSGVNYCHASATRHPSSPRAAQQSPRIHQNCDSPRTPSSPGLRKRSISGSGSPRLSPSPPPGNLFRDINNNNSNLSNNDATTNNSTPITPTRNQNNNNGQQQPPPTTRDEEPINNDHDTHILHQFWRTYDTIIILSIFAVFGIAFRMMSATWFRNKLGSVFSEDSALGTNLPLNMLSCFLMGLFCSGR